MSSALKYVIFGSIISLALSHPTQRERVDSGLFVPDTLNQASPDNTMVKVDTMAEDINEIRYGKVTLPADLRNLPSLHPVIMHFAISLIVVAALLQLMNVFFFKKDIAWIVFLLIVTGFAAAWLSSRTLHPSGLTDKAAELLAYYDLWVQWTLRTALAALILQIIHLGITRFDKLTFISSGRTGVSYRKNKFIMLTIAIVMIASAYSVLRTGHYGAKLVHFEGAGPMVSIHETGH